MLTAEQHNDIAKLANEAGLGAWDGTRIAALFAFLQKVWPIVAPFILPYLIPSPTPAPTPAPVPVPNGPVA